MPATLQRYYGVKGGATNAVQIFPEAAGQSFKAGDLVTSSSGSVAALAASDGAITNAGNKVLGVALRDASGTAGTSIPVKVIGDEDLVLLPVYHATASSAKPANGTVGSQYQLVRSGGVYGIAIDQTSNPVAILCDKLPGMDQEQYGPVWVRILAARRVME